MRLKLLDSYEYDKVHNLLGFALNLFEVRFTDHKLRESIESHLDTPSLAAVQDILSNYGIQRTVIRKGNHSYENFETPFISLIKKQGQSEKNFTVFNKVENGKIAFLDADKNRLEREKKKSMV